MTRFIVAFFTLIFALPISAQGLETVMVAPGVYALVGPLGNRDPENLGNNATFGLVVTEDGAVLIDAGGSYKGAEAIDQAVHTVTDQPVAVVINTGGQDHRWMGNSYWREKGAEIIASEAAVADQQARLSMQLMVLENLIGADGLEGTEPSFADTTFAEQLDFDLGGVHFSLVHAPAHTPGESFVWLPQHSVVFTGDMVYVERMLGIFEFSSSRDWVESFERMAALEPAVIAPGHGAPTDLAGATRDTYDYLTALRAKIRTLIDEGGDMIASAKVDQSEFSYLRNFDELAGRNAQEVFNQMEWE